MKVLFCVEFYFPSVGGAQEVVRQLAERMAARGHDVTVATTRLDERTSDIHNGVQIVGFDVSGNRVRGLQGDVDRYQNYLAGQDADVVFFYAAQQWTFDAAWQVLSTLRSKKVLVPCGYSGLYEKTYQGYFQELPSVLSQMDAVVYHAESYRDIDFGRTLSLDNGVIIPNGADSEEFDAPLNPAFRKSCHAGESTFIALTVGTITGLKGHLELLKAFAQSDFGDREALLILNGNRPEASGRGVSLISRVLALFRGYGTFYALRHIAKQALLAAGVKALTRDSVDAWVARINHNDHGRKRVMQVNLPRPQLIQAYRQSDLFVFASNVEYSPLVLFEACAAGLPFLTVPVGNSAEIVRWTRGGELCEAPVDARGFTRVDPAVLARRIESLANDPEKLQELGRRGKEASVQRFNWASLSAEYEALFQRLLGRDDATRNPSSPKESIQ